MRQSSSPPPRSASIARSRWSDSRAPGVRLEEDGGAQCPRRPEERSEGRAQLLRTERLVLEEGELPPIERLGEAGVSVGKPQGRTEALRRPAHGTRRAGSAPPAAASAAIGKTGRMPYGLPSRVSNRTGPAASGAAVASLIADTPSANSAGVSGTSSPGPSEARSSITQYRSGSRPKPIGEQAVGLRPMPRKLAVRRGPDAEPRAELTLDAGRDPDERRDRHVGAVSPKSERSSSAYSRSNDSSSQSNPPQASETRTRQVDEDGAEQRVVLRRLAAGVRTCVDPGRGLARQLLERDQRIVAPAQPRGACLDEVPNQRSVLVERRPFAADVLLERERERLARIVELAQEIGERAECEGTECVVEVRRARGHEDRYPAGRVIPARPSAHPPTSRAALTAPAPVRRAVHLAEAARAHRGTAPRTGPPCPAVHGPMCPLPCDGARIASRPQPSAARSSSSRTAPTGSHGETRACHRSSASHMFPIPETTRWSTSTSPTTPEGSARRTLARRLLDRRLVRDQVRPEPPHAACVERQHRPVPLRRLPVRRAAGRATAGPAPSATGAMRQRPFIRRWLRTVTPPSNRSSRFFPTASTDSRTRPSTARATPVDEPARVRRRRLYPLADEHLQPLGGAMERVAFGHRWSSRYAPRARQAAGRPSRGSRSRAVPDRVRALLRAEHRGVDLEVIDARVVRPCPASVCTGAGTGCICRPGRIPTGLRRVRAFP